MNSRTSKTISEVTEASFKDLGMTLHSNSEEILRKFLSIFVENLDKKIKLDKAFNRTTIDIELIQNIEQVLLIGKSNPLQAIDQCLKQIREFRAKY